MSKDEKYEIAKQYVDKQLEVMKEANAAPKEMSKEEYKALIEDVAQNVMK
jgi:hypothetical protein